MEFLPWFAAWHLYYWIWHFVLSASMPSYTDPNERMMTYYTKEPRLAKDMPAAEKKAAWRSIFRTTDRLHREWSSERSIATAGRLAAKRFLRFESAYRRRKTCNPLLFSLSSPLISSGRFLLSLSLPLPPSLPLPAAVLLHARHRDGRADRAVHAGEPEQLWTADLDWTEESIWLACRVFMGYLLNDFVALVTPSSSTPPRTTSSVSG